MDYVRERTIFEFTVKQKSRCRTAFCKL